MDMKLCGTVPGSAWSLMERTSAPLYLRDEDAYYAKYGSDWPVLVWTSRIVAIVRRAVTPAARHINRLAQSWRFAISANQKS